MNSYSRLVFIFGFGIILIVFFVLSYLPFIRFRSEAIEALGEQRAEMVSIILQAHAGDAIPVDGAAVWQKLRARADLRLVGRYGPERYSDAETTVQAGNTGGRIHYAVTGADGAVREWLVFEYRLSFLADILAWGGLQVWIFLALFFILGLALTAYFYFLFVLPVFQISRLFAARSIQGLESYTRSGGEIGNMARLLTRFLRQARMLEDEVRRQGAGEAPAGAVFDDSLREALARDLHDGAIQGVYAIGLQVKALESRLKSGHDRVTAEELSLLSDALKQTVADLRGFMVRMEPAELQDRDLEMALLALQKNLEPLAPDAFEIEMEDCRLDALSRQTQVHLYYVIRELLSNALRHANPGELGCRLKQEADGIILEVCNDGFDPTGERRPGSGLRNIAQRVDALGGSFEIDESRKGWFCIRITIPQAAVEAS